jgi:Fe-Mn family superoxide dismutase
MKKFEEQKFSIPELKGMSKKSIEEHLKLYAGYVKHANLILEKIEEYGADSEKREKNAFVLGELQRRFGFEFDGMRNHEFYFRSLEGGAKELGSKSGLKKAIAENFGNFETWLAQFKSIATTRGIGWAVLYYDPRAKRLLNAWVEEQHQGHLSGLNWIFGIDMWEHSYVFDYQPSGKKNYVEDFLSNVNWDTIEENFSKAQG